MYDIRTFDPAAPLAIGEAVLTFAPTIHYVPCWAIRVTAGGTTGDFVYTADAGPTSDLVGFAKGAAVLVAEATDVDPPSPARSQEGDQPRGHLTAGEAADLARDAGATTPILAHLFEEYGFERYRARASAAFPGRLELARPGLVVEW